MALTCVLQAIITKKVIEDYYGKSAEYSYWNACSNGGRQASILAQQYPDAYDGIIAAAPGLYWAELSISSVWPFVFMDLTEQYPRNCELNQLTSLAIEECDDLDGVEDGLIADPEACRATFNATDHVGTVFNCSDTGKDMEISSAAASIAEAAWNGPKYSNGDFMWYGYDIGVDLATAAGTVCSGNGTCIPTQRETAAFWYLEYVERDLTANVTTLTHTQYDELYLTLKKTFAGSLQAAEPRITAFQEAGGKMLTYHGLVSSGFSPKLLLRHAYRNGQRRTLQSLPIALFTTTRRSRSCSPMSPTFIGITTCLDLVTVGAGTAVSPYTSSTSCGSG